MLLPDPVNAACVFDITTAAFTIHVITVEMWVNVSVTLEITRFLGLGVILNSTDYTEISRCRISNENFGLYGIIK